MLRKIFDIIFLKLRLLQSEINNRVHQYDEVPVMHIVNGYCKIIVCGIEVLVL